MANSLANKFWIAPKLFQYSGGFSRYCLTAGIFAKVALQKLITEAHPKMTAAQLARAAGMQTAQISRIRNGIQVWVNPDDIHKIALAVCKDETSSRFSQVHSKLLYARLQDECCGPGAKYICPDLLTHECGTPPKPKPVLPPSLQENLDLIGENIASDRSVRELIEGVANLCRRTPTSGPASR
jgi:hypothetical protein